MASSSVSASTIVAIESPKVARTSSTLRGVSSTTS
jgi:hypothetical protein